MQSATINTTSEYLATMDLGNTTSFPYVKPLLSPAQMNLALLLIFFLSDFPLAFMGCCTNTANMIVYYKMGFSESSTLNFFILSVFDFFLCFNAAIGGLLFNSLVQKTSVGPLLSYIATSMGRTLFVCASGSAMTTVLISTERCLCVVFPLKIKTWLTHRRRVCILLTVIAYHVAYLFLLYVDAKPPYDLPSKKLALYYFSMYVVPLHVFFVIVILNTIFLVVRLRVTQQWRKESTTQSDKNEDKENKLAKTVIAISTLFIAGAFPIVVLFITEVAYPKFTYTDPYFYTLSFVVYVLSTQVQQFSSAANIFFYYKMSSRYRKVFSATFKFRKAKTSENKASA